jgi:hypothetical protein
VIVPVKDAPLVRNEIFLELLQHPLAGQNVVIDWHAEAIVNFIGQNKRFDGQFDTQPRFGA